jgi:acetate---CoA ligase (ADP-forming) subunit beta
LIVAARDVLLQQARSRGDRALTEFQAKRFLSDYGLPVPREQTVNSLAAALAAAEAIGYPVALKGSGAELLHKTELGLVKLGLKNAAGLREAYDQLTGAAKVPLKEMLVQQLVAGDRELLAGMVRDPQFGPCVLFGLGGIYTEALADVTFRVAPLSRWDARQMMEELRGRKILDAFRGMPPVDREALVDILTRLGEIGLENPLIREIDINPLKIRPDGRPIALDALLILG